MDGALFKQLQALADERALSLNQYCLKILSRAPHSENLQMIDLIKKYYKESLNGIVLFGSHARDTATTSSDIDILLVLDESLPLRSKLYSEWEKRLASDMAATVSPHFAHLPPDAKQVGSLWLEVALEGKVLWDPYAKVQHMLKNIRDRVSSGEYQRKMTYGVPYWTKRAI